MKKGFTLIEVLVASLLLGMLVTILTMIFNQSSIAWRTGRAGVAKLSNIRYKLSSAQYFADNALPRIDTSNGQKHGYIAGAWNINGELNERGVKELPNSAKTLIPGVTAWNNANFYENNQLWQNVEYDNTFDTERQSSYTVGVLSYGPDGEKDTEDDICSWPEAVE